MSVDDEEPLLLGDAPPPVPPRRRAATRRLEDVNRSAALGVLLLVGGVVALIVFASVAGGSRQRVAAEVGPVAERLQAPAAADEETAAQPATDDGDAAAPPAQRRRDVDSGTVQKQIRINDAATDDDVTFRVTRIWPVQSIPLYGTSLELPRQPDEKLVRLDLRWKNNMGRPADLFCAGARGAVLLDAFGKNYRPLRSSLDAEGNEQICNEPVPPGGTQAVKLWYRLEAGTPVGGAVIWNNLAEDDPGGGKTDVFVAAR